MTRLWGAARPSRRLQTDEGFTLIEIVVGLLLVTLVMGAFAAMLLGGVANNRKAEHRSWANQLAQKQLESLKSLPWASVGLYAADCGYWGDTDPLTGEKTVTLTASPRDANGPVPIQGGTCAATNPAVSSNGTTFQVQTHVTWITLPNGTTGATGAYDSKHITVKVIYTLQGKTRSIQVDETRAPTSVEMTPTVPSGSAIPAFTVTPTVSGSQTLTSGGALTQAVTLQATTSLVASSVIATYPTTTGTQTATLGYNNVTGVWTATIAAGACCFNAGTETFTFQATSSSGQTTQGTAQITLSAASTSCGASAAVSPNPAQLDSSGNLTQPVGLSLTTTTAVTNVTASFTRSGAPATVSLAGAASGKSWTASLPTGNGTYTSGAQSFSFAVTGAACNQTVVTTITMASPQAAVAITALTFTGGSATAGQTCATFTGNGSNSIGTTTRATTVTITVSNVLSTDIVTLAWPSGHTGSTPVSGVSATLATGPDSTGRSTWTVTLPSGYVFDTFKTNPYTFTASAKRASDTAAAQTYTADLTLKTNGVAPCT